MSLPLSLEIVGTDRSHPEAGGQGPALIACRSVANDTPILGRLFRHLASPFIAFSEGLPRAIFVLVEYCIFRRQPHLLVKYWSGTYQVCAHAAWPICSVASRWLEERRVLGICHRCGSGSHGCAPGSGFVVFIL